MSGRDESHKLGIMPPVFSLENYWCCRAHLCTERWKHRRRNNSFSTSSHLAKYSKKQANLSDRWFPRKLRLWRLRLSRQSTGLVEEGLLMKVLENDWWRATNKSGRRLTVNLFELPMNNQWPSLFSSHCLSLTHTNQWVVAATSTQC